VKIKLVSVLILVATVTLATTRPIEARSAEQGLQASQAALRLTVTIVRVNAKKEIANLPFMLMVLPNMTLNGPDGDRVSVQNGSELPIPSTTMAGPNSVPSYQYRSVGTSVSAAARNAGDGVYNIVLNVTDSQVLSDMPETSFGGLKLPRFQSFTSSSRLLLRDGQTVQFTAATDKVSNDIIRLDVTMNVIK
jgi:hypothetical protein